MTGGVEKVSKNFLKTLTTIFGSTTKNWKALSLHDKQADIDERYVDKANYKGYNGNRPKFIAAAVKNSFKFDIVVLSHINLLLVTEIIRFFNPKCRFILFAHGIEVWRDLAKWKVNFINKHVEVWAVSNFTKQKMIVVHGILPTRISILNNSLSPFFPLPTNFEQPKNLIEKYNLAKNTPILYTLNRLSSTEQYKGYDNVINALSELKKEGQTFYYLIAGKADLLEHQRITSLIAKKDLQEEVKLIGYLTTDELIPHFLLSDVFVMPSSGEGFGIVFIEAAACGIQVIGGNVDGSTDALLNGALGQLVHPTNIQEIKQAIKSAIHNKEHQPLQQQDLAVANFGFAQYVTQVKGLLG